MLGPWLEQEFGEKTIKLSLDGGFTCPNRDGTCGTGGCSFCSERGSGDNASMLFGANPPEGSSNIEYGAFNNTANIQNAISDQFSLLSDKWPNAKSFIAYFQNYTGTYASTERLRELYYVALTQPHVRGLAIATRPDCLPEETLDLLDEINQKHFLWVELGLQTTNDKTAESFGRGYKTAVYHEAVRELTKRNIKVVTHLLLGLPEEMREDILQTLSDVIAPIAIDCNSQVTSQSENNSPSPPHIWGLKFHLLNIVKGTRLAEELPEYVPFDSPESYVSLVCDLLERTPRDIVIHRLSADSPAELLIAPKWAYRKRLIINMVNAEMASRGSYQGSLTQD
ncbi:MAG: TIGR01212 family radical SAM protein [Firmicutes bacterium]|nr:TIGR01212 family radical SAM protein [Bacillota bacterium]